MAKIRIMGTSHIAEESIKTIRKEFEKETPEVVALEIDAQRLPFLLSKKKRKAKLSDIMRLGFGGFLFNTIGAYVQKKLGARVGLIPGADIRSAINEARKAESNIFLIDQPVQITLKRLSTEMGFFSKMKFIFYLLSGFIMQPPRELRNLDLKKVPGPELIEYVTRELRKKFPALHKVLVEERNKYMAKQLLILSYNFPEKTILAVVGAGHAKGLKKLLNDSFFKKNALKHFNGQMVQLESR